MDDPRIQYIDNLEEQCEKWEQMYNEIKAERDQLKEQLNIATNGPSAMIEKSPAPHQVRHI